MVEQPNTNSNNGAPREGGNRKRRRRRRGKKGGGNNAEATQQARGPEGRDKGQSQGQNQGQKAKQKSGKGQKAKASTPKEEKPPKRIPKPREHIVRKYDVIFFDNFNQAHADLDSIRAKAASCDQLNVVIRAEGNMDDPELLQIEKVKVFAGTAWTTIHERRVEDGWYNEPR